MTTGRNGLAARERLRFSLRHAHNIDCHLLSKSMGLLSSRFRFSKRIPAKNVVPSELEVGTQEYSNCFEEGLEAEERRKNGALFLDAPKEIRTPVLGLKGLRPSPLDDGGHYSGKILSSTPLAGQAEYRFSVILQ